MHASLHPFRGWRLPPEAVWQFLAAPWPRYITLEDVVINLAAYVPLGLLYAAALRPRFATPAAVLAAALLAAAVSFAMESAQMFLPTRIASNVDLLTNGAGALFGAMAAPLLSPTGFPGRALAAWRRRAIVPGPVADAGLVIVCLWLFTHLHPTAQLFGTGNLRGTFELPVYFIHTAPRLLTAEALVAFLNLLGLGLLIGTLARSTARPLPAIAAVIGAGLLAKSLAAGMLFEAPTPLAWLTPGVALGLVAGALLLYPLLRLPPLAKVVAALACVVAAAAVINFAPDNPYQTLPPRLVPGSTTHLLRLSNIVRALSELWPFLAAVYLIGAATTSARERRSDRL